VVGFVPKEMFFTKGVGKHREKLTSFELALRSAGIAACNLVRVSSIFPPKCRILSRAQGSKRLEPGQVTFVVMSEAATREPHRFNRLVLSGIGKSVFDTDDTTTRRIVAALEGEGDPDDNLARMFVQYAGQTGNDLGALTAVMKRIRTPMSPASLAAVTCPTLIVIGDRDFAGPGEPLAEALPNATLRTLRNVDHFATPEAFGFIDATLQFLDAVPL